MLVPSLSSAVEAVEKVFRQTLGRDAEKSDLIECATVNDLTLGRVKGPTKTSFSGVQKTFLHARYPIRMKQEVV
jgi:hypothetical protein